MELVSGVPGSCMTRLVRLVCPFDVTAGDVSGMYF